MSLTKLKDSWIKVSLKASISPVSGSKITFLPTKSGVNILVIVASKAIEELTGDPEPSSTG